MEDTWNSDGTCTTDCDDCGRAVTLKWVDEDGVLIGDECGHCGAYVTRYVDGPPA